MMCTLFSGQNTLVNDMVYRYVLNRFFIGYKLLYYFITLIVAIKTRNRACRFCNGCKKQNLRFFIFMIDNFKCKAMRIKAEKADYWYDLR